MNVNRRLVAALLIAAMVLMTGCIGGEDAPSQQEPELTSGGDYDTDTYPAAGTDKVWTCIEWEDYNGHKMECELVNSTTQY